MVARKRRAPAKWFDQELKAPKVERAHSRKLKKAWSMTEAELAQLTAAINKLNVK